MSVWAIADLHLSFGIKDKKMDVFGEEWVGWTEKIARSWHSLISSEDLILLPGDFSWATRLEDVKPDLKWLDQLPGTKVLLRGNHDYWWSSVSKVKKILPPSVHIIQNNAFQWKNISIAGARLWDTPEYQFINNAITEKNVREKIQKVYEEDQTAIEKIFSRELGRLEVSLKQLHPDAEHRLAMTHYPPIAANLKKSRASELLEKYRVSLCVFGHLHGFSPGSLPFGKKNGVRYLLTSCDYIQFTPLRIL